ncbi:hypothetical protein [uncultured Reyranella sp.]|uniref:hypothetical protein n=1 Tax=uncultured Reyranella sp. TaxID=735512 RepID=UPI0025CD3A2D|nr:hypothetical protein [uncultured Reyranella sp.]
MINRFAASLAVLVAFGALPALAQQQPKPTAAAATTKADDDKYVGYYYPKPTAIENYASPMQTIAGAERAQRVQFATVVSQGTIQSAYRVPYSVFVKGEKADKMIIVGLQPGEMSTIYRARAILANMTTMSRLSPFFQERTIAEDANFFDLLKLLGFQQITISDGDKFTHQVNIK